MATDDTNKLTDDGTSTNKCASLRLLQKRRELRDAQELLRELRDAVAQRQEEFKLIESELHETYNDSKEKAKQHMLQNDLKRTRAKERCGKEEQLCRELDKDMAVLQERLQFKG